MEGRKNRKKRIIIAKVKDNTGAVVFVKYNVRNVEAFARFLESKFLVWYYMNIYSKESSVQVGNYTKNSPRPLTNL